MTNLVKIPEAKEIQTEEYKLDENGLIIHEEGIEFKCSHNDLLFIHTVCKDMLEANLVPPMEVDKVITLMEMLAEQEKKAWDYGCFFLPINYFIGMWHCLNTGRSFDIYSKNKTKANTLDQITYRAAEQIDLYHAIKVGKEPNDKSKKNQIASFQKVVDELKQITDKSSQS